MTACADLHARCMALGARLFTVTALDQAAGLHRRVYTSHPEVYPLSGTKPLDRDDWYAACIAARRTFLANTPAEFERHFFDHALIVSLGLGSCINVPVVDGAAVSGTVNVLAEPGHFTPARLAAYEALVAEVEAALATELC